MFFAIPTTQPTNQPTSQPASQAASQPASLISYLVADRKGQLELRFFLRRNTLML
jgi:hypothetical protein